MSAERLVAETPSPSLHCATVPAEVAEVYIEMFELLEEYAPVWYMEDLHNRAEAGLRAIRAMRKPSPAKVSR